MDRLCTRAGELGPQCNRDGEGRLDRRDGYQTHVGCVDPTGIRGDELRAGGVPVVSFPIRTLVSPRTAWQGLRLAAYIQRHGIELVHSFDVPMNVFGVPFAWLARPQVLLSSQRAHRELTPGLNRKLLRATDLGAADGGDLREVFGLPGSRRNPKFRQGSGSGQWL
ncbi:MAG: hypothetical protein ACKV2U_02400 [Bryobacteraceae bacterium]